ncbi:hypothetical protein TNCV_2454971 [Trichonephila clavipes]|nr:hypothetical protein TNCV_2454971 [Trichonephila clavipes]
MLPMDNRLRIVTVGSLVIRASDCRPEGLGSMPPNTLQVHTEYVLVKSVGPKVLWAGSRLQGLSPPVLCQNCGGCDESIRNFITNLLNRPF